jgi:hypothetical protein
VQVLDAVHLAQDDVADPDILLTNWRDRHQLAAFHFSGHAVSARAELHSLALQQLLDVLVSPSHVFVRTMISRSEWLFESSSDEFRY